VVSTVMPSLPGAKARLRLRAQLNTSGAQERPGNRRAVVAVRARTRMAVGEITAHAHAEVRLADEAPRTGAT
jgi:hypothetical protein